MTGELEKLIIEAFNSPDSTAPDGSYTTAINPDQISFEQKVEYTKPDPATKKGPEFNGISSPQLNLKLLFDGTGLISTGTPLNVDSKLGSVNTQIENFKKVVTRFEGEIHETKFLKIVWGEILFKGKAETLKTNYTLFKPDGTPLRATVEVGFIGKISVQERVKRDGEESPDLTHVRTIMEGDTLPLMCERVYNDSRQYLNIAKVNKLSNYRNLSVGTKLFFPPIKSK